MKASPPPDRDSSTNLNEGSAALSRLPSHVAIFEELLSEIPLLHDLGYVQHSSYWHAPHLAGWHGMWPIIESRRLLLLRRQK